MEHGGEGEPGRRAGRNGNAFERILLPGLETAGYRWLKGIPDDDSEPVESRIPFFIPRWYGKHLRTLAGTLLVPDYYVWHAAKYPMGCLVECKWQQSSGTVDEKIYYRLHSLLQTGLPAVLALGGAKFRKALLVYYKRFDNSAEGGNLRVFVSTDDLIVAMNKGLF